MHDDQVYVRKEGEKEKEGKLEHNSLSQQNNNKNNFSSQYSDGTGRTAD